MNIPPDDLNQHWSRPCYRWTNILHWVSMNAGWTRLLGVSVAQNANANYSKICFWLLTHIIYMSNLLESIRIEIAPAFSVQELDMQLLVEKSNTSPHHWRFLRSNHWIENNRGQSYFISRCQNYHPFSSASLWRNSLWFRRRHFQSISFSPKQRST